ncbi:MAG: hypothetical protein Q9191_005688 [Dirinaria sp. TL-2023a]
MTDRHKVRVPYRQIRASYDTETITLYQAYCAEIAIPAVKEQRLCASPRFSFGRMTWIKPSWCWMMYRSGYSHKDPHQTHILALSMTHENFAKLLSEAVVLSNHGGPLSKEARSKEVRVQWDPERDFKLGVLPYRSIQIGISGEIVKKWVENWIEKIEDVTHRARELKAAVDEEVVDAEALAQKGLLPVEREYDVSEQLREILEMNVIGEKS